MLDRNLLDPEARQGSELLSERAGADSPDQHLGKCDRARGERVARGEDRRGGVRVRVGVVEVGEQDARIENGQSGHSSRSRSR